MLGDIALIYLKNPSTAKTVALDDGTFANAGGWYIVAGWGKDQTQQPSDTLKWVAVPAITPSQFNTWRNGYIQSTGKYVQGPEADHLIAGLGQDGADSCVGDSGGPLFAPGPGFTNSDSSQDVVVGVVSYGPTSVCGTQNNVGFYTKVSYWAKWINNVIVANNW